MTDPRGEFCPQVAEQAIGHSRELLAIADDISRTWPDTGSPHADDALALAMERAIRVCQGLGLELESLARVAIECAESAADMTTTDGASS